MGEIDKRKKLAEQPFDYEITKGGLVLLYWGGKHIKTLSGKAAEKFIAEVDDLDEQAAQLVMAKATGNFKRGNERKA
jgi:hypothetical protein